MNPATSDAVMLLNYVERSIDPTAMIDTRSPAAWWLINAGNHLLGYEVVRPEYRASVQWPDARRIA